MSLVPFLALCLVVPQKKGVDIFEKIQKERKKKEALQKEFAKEVKTLNEGAKSLKNFQRNLRKSIPTGSNNTPEALVDDNLQIEFADIIKEINRGADYLKLAQKDFRESIPTGNNNTQDDFKVYYNNLLKNNDVTH